MSQKKEVFVVLPSTAAKPASVHPTLPGALDRAAKDVGGMRPDSKEAGRKILEGGSLPNEGKSFSGKDGSVVVKPAEAP